MSKKHRKIASELDLVLCLFVWALNVLVINQAISRVPRLTSYVLPHTKHSGETMTSVSAGHTILTPTQPAATAGIEHRTSSPGVIRSYFEREHKVKTNESKSLKTDEAAQAKGHRIHDEESKMKDNKLTNKRSCDKGQTRTINMNTDNNKLVTRL